MNFNTVARFNRAGTFNVATYMPISSTYLDLSTLDVESVDGVVPNTANNVNYDKTTGTALAFQSYPVTWTVDWDIDGEGNEVKVSEMLSGRIRRIAADDNGIAGEVMLHGFYVQLVRNKIGATP